MPLATATRLLSATTLLAIAGATQPVAAADSYDFDTAHTEVLFSYSHLGNSRAYGRFNEVSGDILLDQDDPSQSRIDVAIAATSVDTGVAAFDTHLASADFFEAETYPEIRFVSTEVRPTGDDTAEVTGDLTIKETTREVVLDVQLNYIGEHQLGEFVPDYAGLAVAGFSATATIQRSDFGLDMLVPMVGDEVELIIETELLRPLDATN